MHTRKEVKSVLNRHKRPDPWFHDEYSANPYEGCSCNCLYCYVRGSIYGENMEEGLVIKTNALQVLEKQLANRSKKSQFGIVALGSATDAYMPVEKDLRMTEGFLKLFLKYRFPVFISTKRTLITRDIDLLKRIDDAAILPPDLLGRLQHGAILSVSISTLNEEMSAMLEPGATPPGQRLELVTQLKREGFLAGVNAIPMLPYISDTEEELEKLVIAAKQCGADYILVGGLTLFGTGQSDSKTLYRRFLQKFRPGLIPVYDKLYGEGYSLPAHYLKELSEKASRLCLKCQIRNRIIE